MHDNKANQIIVRNSDHHENLPSILETLELLGPYFKNDCHFKTTNEKCGLVNDYTRKELASSCLVVELAIDCGLSGFMRISAFSAYAHLFSHSALINVYKSQRISTYEKNPDGQLYAHRELSSRVRCVIPG